MVKNPSTETTKKRVGSSKVVNSSSKTSHKSRRRLLITLGALAAVVLTVAGFYFYTVLSAGNDVLGGNIYEAVTKNEPLSKDRFGRTNILIFGTSEDDKGHSGAMLADSIIVLSVNQDTMAANTISIPRDLWVKYPEPCIVGSEGKINAAYFCGVNGGQSEARASKAFADTVGKIIGTDMHYYAKINFGFVRDSVNSLDGIEVSIKSDDPRGIYDVSTGLRLPSGPVALNGNQALDLARARNSGGGYGLSRSNFDRELNQQLIIRALQDKALSTGTFANPLKISRLSDALSSNVVTNIPSSSTKTIVNIAKNLPSANIVSIDLAPKKKPLLITGQIGSQSTVYPTAGLYNYKAIAAITTKYFGGTK